MNRKVAVGFGAVLVLTGILGLLHAPSPMSSAVPYDVFHVVFGLVGIGCGACGLRCARAFNVGFGVGDLYQAVAQACGWFPGAYFLWKPADLAVHVILGVALVGIGLFFKDPRSDSSQAADHPPHGG